MLTAIGLMLLLFLFSFVLGALARELSQHWEWHQRSSLRFVPFLAAAYERERGGLADDLNRKMAVLVFGVMSALLFLAGAAVFGAVVVGLVEWVLSLFGGAAR
ncbi:hypothetical protein SUDANB121_05670 [Nocardiopsis dassonvillei]|uniref:hypothetical protein n=1 Tax=Nocardiopsis dassonvillei TaxID=2014 RepID=UPI003F54EF99